MRRAFSERISMSRLLFVLIAFAGLSGCLTNTRALRRVPRRSPTEDVMKARSVTFHVMGMMKTKSGAT